MWTHNGKTYGIPQEAYTVELYYSKDLMKKLGVSCPRTGNSAGAVPRHGQEGGRRRITPILQGIGDRPYPGVYMTEEPLLRSSDATTQDSSPASCPTRTRAWSRCSTT